MKIKRLLNRMYKRTWTKRVAMTDRSLGLVVLVAAAAGATAAVLTKGCIRRIRLNVSASRLGATGGNNPPEFPQSYMDHE